MARIRSIKPEFWTSEQVLDCSTTARLAFIGMWNFCDDAGIHPASAKTLKAEVFPADDILVSDVQRLVDELKANDLIVEYESAGKRYWQVTGWHHQKIEKPNYKHPKPEIPLPVADESPTTPLPVADDSTPEGKGEEGKGEEGKGEEGKGEEKTHASGTSTGVVCARLKSEARLTDVNPSHPKLLALIKAGLSEGEILAAGHEAHAKGKGFAYALAIAEGRRRDAANVKPLPPKPATGSLSKAGQKTADAAARWLESQGVQP